MEQPHAGQMRNDSTRTEQIHRRVTIGRTSMSLLVALLTACSSGSPAAQPTTETPPSSSAVVDTTPTTAASTSAASTTAAPGATVATVATDSVPATTAGPAPTDSAQSTPSTEDVATPTTALDLDQPQLSADQLATAANTDALFDAAGDLPMENALAAFANMYQEPMAGVTAWPGTIDESISGLVYHHVVDHYDMLSAEQQAAVDRVRGPRGVSITVGAADAGDAGDAGDGPSRAQHAAKDPGTAPGTAPGAEPVPVPPGNVVPTLVQQERDFAIQFLNENLSWNIEGVVIDLAWLPTVRPDGGRYFSGVAGGSNQGIHDLVTGRLTGCDIRLNSDMNSNFLKMRSFMVHEVFHCFQAKISGSEDDDELWVTEGSAAWVTGKYIGIASYPTWWDLWTTQPSVPLHRRTYTAVGFFSLVERSGVDIWVAMEDLIRNPVPEILLHQIGNVTQFNELWGTHFANQPAWGPMWDVTGLGSTATHGYGPTVNVPSTPSGVAIGNGEIPVLDRDYWAITRTAKTLAPVMRIRATASVNGGIHIGSYGSLLQSIDVAVCTVPTGCVCPNGSNPMNLQLAGSDVAYIGIGPSSEGATVKLSGQSLDEFCQSCPLAPLARLGGRHSATPPDGGVCRPAEPPTEPASDDCAVGTWRSQEWYGSPDPVTQADPFTAGGQGVVLTLNADGTMSIDYSAMTPLLKRDVADGNVIDIQLVFAGSAGGTWSTGPGGRITGTADTRGVSIHGTITAGNQTLPVIDANLAALSGSAGEATGTPYTVANCAGDGMAIETVYQTTTAGILFERIG